MGLGFTNAYTNSGKIQYAIYVDDCLIACSCGEVVAEQREQLMSLFEAKHIKPTKFVYKGTEFEKRDLLGLDLMYSRSERRVIFS